MNKNKASKDKQPVVTHVTRFEPHVTNEREFTFADRVYHTIRDGVRCRQVGHPIYVGRVIKNAKNTTNNGDAKPDKLATTSMINQWVADRIEIYLSAVD